MPWKPSEPGEVPTLGYDVIDWITTYLAAPDRAEYEPFVPYPEQEEFILRFYELNPKTGKRRYRRGVLSRPRGWGKSPLLGALACAEALAPVVPDGWDADGQPVGKPWALVRTPFVQVAAVSEEQTKNTWAPLLEMLAYGPACDEYPGLEPLGSFVNLPRGKIEPIASSARSVKGNKPVFAVLDQALQLGTMIPTPNGWTTMGELKAGDTVFGSAGQPVTILQAKPPSADHDCYRVTFADGTSVIASDGHLWHAKLAGSQAAERIRTTGEMYRDGSGGTHALRARRRVLLREALLLEPSQSNNALAHEFGASPKTVASIRAKLIRAGIIQDVERRGGGPAKLEKYRPAAQVAGAGVARRFMIPVAPAQQLPEAELAVPPYLLGYWLGDGTRGKCELSVHGDDLHEVQARLLQVGVESWARRYAPTGKGFSSADSDQVNLTFSRSRGYQCENRPAAAKALAALPCYRDKHVPSDYFQGSVEQRTELLRGLMDSDGSCTIEGTCTFVSTQQVLADAVTTLLRSLGQVTSGPKWVADPRYSNGGKYRVDFTPRAGMVPFGLSRKASRVHDHRRGPGWISIFSIEPVDRVPVRCIEVDSDDHLFAFGEAGHLTHNTEEWVSSNGGLHLFETMKNNAAKIGGSFIESPNAYTPGDGSVAENSAQFYASIREGRAWDDGLVYDHREAPPTTDLWERESLVLGLRTAYGDSSGHPDGCVLHKPACPPGHVDLDVLVATVWDPTSDVQQSRSDFLNQVTHASDAWLTSPQWGSCSAPERVIADGATIVLGFDGSIRDDSTALVACDVVTGHLWIPETADGIACWEKPDNRRLALDWEVDRVAVDAAVAACVERYRVIGMYCDPAHWQDSVDRWTSEFGKRFLVKATGPKPLEWWTNRPKNMVDALERFHDAAVAKEPGLSHDGGSVLARHVLNARRRVVRQGIVIAKDHPHSPNKIDAAMAAVLAYECRSDAVAKGFGRERKARKAAAF